MRLAVLAASAGMAMLGAVPASAAGADKLYVLDCGHMSAADQSRCLRASMSGCRSSFPTIAT